MGGRAIHLTPTEYRVLDVLAGRAGEVVSRADLLRSIWGSDDPALAESLGGIGSPIEHPGRMTHASVAGTDLEVPADLIRLSVGIETAEDLLADLDRALG